MLQLRHVLPKAKPAIALCMRPQFLNLVLRYQQSTIHVYEVVLLRARHCAGDGGSGNGNGGVGGGGTLLFCAAELWKCFSHLLLLRIF